MEPAPPAGHSVMLVNLRVRPGLARALDIGLATLITLNVAAVVLETVAGIAQRHGALLHAFELVSVVIFSAEYGVRLWLSPRHPSGRFARPLTGRLRFALTPMALIDLAAILPAFLGVLLQLDLRFLRALRLLRIFKLTRHSSAMTILLDVLRQEARSFGAALSVLVVILLLASSGIYLVEHEAQPEAFGSIPAAMWWAVATLTTVGYGDVTPITDGGKFFGALVTIVGVGMVALPAGILSSAFSDHLRRRREAFQAEVERAREQGTLDSTERLRLERLGSELGLSGSGTDGPDLPGEQRTSQPSPCPHCGRS